jgi:3-oxoacyl-[acyl-carrier protein] reductase
VTIKPSDILLNGRAAVMTGAGARIGRGIAAGMATEAIGALGIVADVRDGDQVNAAPERSAAELGPVTILVNAAVAF